MESREKVIVLYSGGKQANINAKASVSKQVANL